MTTTGPFELSGTAAGVSVEGPIASVSERFKLVGGAGLSDDMMGACALGAGIVSEVCGTVISTGAMVVVVVLEGCAVMLVAAGVTPDDGNVLISTGLDDSSSWVLSLSVRDPTIGCCGLPCAAVCGWSAPVEAMLAVFLPSNSVSGDNECNVPSE